jgi:hypothetical protein
MTNTQVTVHNGHHVSTVVVKSDNHINVVHVYHNTNNNKDGKKDDK